MLEIILLSIPDSPFVLMKNVKKLSKNTNLLDYFMKSANMKKPKYRIIHESEYVVIHTFGKPDYIITLK